MAASLPPNVSPPFALREANGRLLMEELWELKDARVPPAELCRCAVALRALKDLPRPEALERIRSLRGSLAEEAPAISDLLRRWADKVKTEADVGALASHFERLSLVASLLSVLRRGGEG